MPIVHAPPPRRRTAGILLHPTSLPGPGGIGTLGAEAHRFAALLADMGVRVWQVLPLGPTGYGDSPYQAFSAFAGNELLIDVEGASAGAQSGARGRADVPEPLAAPARDGARGAEPVGGTAPAVPGAATDDATTVDYAAVVPRQRAALARAVAAFAPDDDFHAFVAAESDWLEDYALFMALKAAHGGAPWTAWEPGAAQRDPAALAAWRARLAPTIHQHRVAQYLFDRQARAWRAACAARGIRLMGDLPIYVAHDSADVWAHRALFQLDRDGRPLAQAGVPPDYFSATGQLWGNPLYDWAAMAADGYAWWTRRMRAALARFDLVRIDHFRGFEAYWEVPGDATTAVDGRWVHGPGAALFDAMAAALGPLPIVAENLGLITPAVEALRTRCGFPGMAVLQFAFGPGGADGAPLRLHDLTRDTVVYTGTHDNDTCVGWWTAEPSAATTQDAEAHAAERAFARRYLATTGDEIHWTMIRAAFASVADLAVVPLQDVLGLGSEARMNVPGRAEGNWRWRFAWGQVTPAVVGRVRELVELYGR